MSKELIRSETEGLPPWMRMMREAVMESVTAEDVSQMVKDQVEKAKKGDAAALKFVFDHVLGGNQLKGATFNQHNYYGDEADPRKPSRARPGTNGKVAKIRARVSAGLPAFSDDDAEGDED